MERIAMLGATLGLSQDFVQDAIERGEAAVIDRAEMVDRTGAQARILTMAAQLGGFLDGQLAEGAKTSLGVVDGAIQRIGIHNGVPPEMAVGLLGTVLEVYQRAAGRLARGMMPEAGNGNDVEGNSRGERAGLGGT
jgi:hypothetical protein